MPGGSFPEPPGILFGYDLRGIPEVACKPGKVYDQQRKGHPMFRFTERSLVAAADAAGFAEVGMELTVTTRTPQPIRREQFLRRPLAPSAPPLSAVMADVLNEEERVLLEEHLRPLVESGQGRVRQANACLWGIRP